MSKKISVKEKSEIIKSLFDFDKICEILGYGEADSSFSSEEEANLERLEIDDNENFKKLIYQAAAENGNFEESILNNVALPI